MADDKKYSQGEILAIIKQVNQENFILANAARMVYFAGFHKNEIENINIGNVLQAGAIVSEIEPFLPETTRAYSKLPIILNDESKIIIEDHINKLTKFGYPEGFCTVAAVLVGGEGI